MLCADIDLVFRRMRILITGAAGSGTSTLARSLGAILSATVLEADDYFWLPTSPPFTTKRDPQERLALLLHDLNRTPSAVIAGSIVDCGLELEDSMSLIGFLTVPARVRVERLRLREQSHVGRIDPNFLEWAAQYDEGRLQHPMFRLLRWDDLQPVRSARLRAVDPDT